MYYTIKLPNIYFQSIHPHFLHCIDEVYGRKTMNWWQVQNWCDLDNVFFDVFRHAESESEVGLVQKIRVPQISK